MAEIILNVDERAAQKWQSVSQKKRNKLSKLISYFLDLYDEDILTNPKPGYGLLKTTVINKQIKKIRKNESAYTKFLEAIRKEANDNGLTQEILDQLLAEDE